MWKENRYFFILMARSWGLLWRLRTALTKKSSVSYHNVYDIYFDEFVIESKGHSLYAKSEVVQFFEFYETVARLRENVRVFLHFKCYIGCSIPIFFIGRYDRKYINALLEKPVT